METPDNERLLETITTDAKFNALRKEVEYRTQAQLALVTLNVTVAGVIGGLIVKKDPWDPSLFSLLAWISPSLGMLWLDHALAIDRLGDFCRSMGFEWEARVWERRKRAFLRMLFGTHIYLMFAGPGIVALYVWKSKLLLRFLKWPEGPEAWAWNGALILIGLYTAILFEFVFGPAIKSGWSTLRKRRQQPSSDLESSD